MLGPPGRKRPSKKEEEDTFLLSLFGHHLHPRQQRTAGGRKSWVADCPETRKGSAEPSPQIQKGQDTLACLPVLTKHAPPHSGTHSLADDLAQPPDSLQHTRSPPTLNRTPELDGLQPTSCRPCRPSLSSRAGFFQPEPRSAPSTAISGNRCLTRLLLPIIYLFLLFPLRPSCQRRAAVW